MSLLDLDAQYPALSAIVREVSGLTLETLADRAPAHGYDFYDLERLCADVRASQIPVDNPFLAGLGGDTQIQGYLAISNEYVARGFVRKRPSFVRRKLLVLKTPKPTPSPTGYDCLDTIMECSWGLFFADNFPKVEEERPLPGDKRKNADFWVEKDSKALWIDCVSPHPQADKTMGSLEAWIEKWAREKWKEKFSAASKLPVGLATGLAITMIKTRDPDEGNHGMFDALAMLDWKRTFDEPIGTPPDQFWADCPGLEIVWVGEPQVCSTASSPLIIREWRRPCHQWV